ncbi:hypothetical protein [Shewanella xiamenensis]|uniref:hypothetical protein n=1 Tax=Shewanella xiamenensis TaxID=332186 RepID=UPI0024A6AE78|nr:hypothetical protein [Shewanella xiamenensis]MDI5854079.1 hypothetical protein [Shewanella xiamenensis]MDI5858062.1 hypothetical protein [Shewanella xiamenensis]MDI5866100.1 hypothetical protein [Shewanella xiamenensis]MDI5869971.1 hypothetical protein [Shewanella xiamenensis]
MNEMAKLISTFRVKETHAELLRDKAVELTIGTKEVVKEADIIHWILEREIKKVKLNEWIESNKVQKK